MNCEMCAFNNPRLTATGVIVRDGSVLLLKRAQEPFKNMWDFAGGYAHADESPEVTLKRELKEELSVDAKLTFIASIPGTASWKEKEFPILSFCYLADIGTQDLVLNEESSEFRWLPIKDLNPKDIAFDSNQTLAAVVKEKFYFDIPRVRELVRQLDPQAEIKEQVLYQAVIEGYVAKEFDGEKLIGMGWIFPRQTMLRRQAVVEDMIVDDAYRGKGLGRKIFRDLIRWAREKGVEVIELTTNPKRIAANELYKSEGFQLHPTNHYLFNL